MVRPSQKTKNKKRRRRRGRGRRKDGARGGKEEVKKEGKFQSVRKIFVIDKKRQQ
jgi:hypothetical protein